MIFWSSVIIILLFLLIFIISKHVTESRTPQNFPPGPRPLPFIGSLHMLDLKRPHKTFVELSKKYGSVFSIQLGMKKMVVLTGYETVKEALVNHGDTFGDRARVPLFDQIYKGLGNPFNTAVIMNASVANIIVAILLGHRYDYEDPTFLRLVNLISETLRLQGSPIATLYSIYPKLGFLPGSHKNIFENVKELHSFIKSIFIKHLKHLDENDQRSFIDVFLVKKEEEKANPNSYFHDDNLTSVVRNLFIAGTETTSTTLNWALLLMMKYPEIQEKVQKEIERVIGSSQPRIDHRKQMPYTDAVIHEIQRFADIVPMNLPRETTTDTYFKGYFLPKGTYIVPLLTSVLKDKSQFEKPEDFNPQHFLDSAGNFVKKDAFMPFSAGRRVCMGETLAKMELFLFFTSLLQKFIFRPPPGVTHFDLTPAVGTTTPPMPYLLCALPRS
ncbi:cytochrome P450 2K6-like isoform X2 [Rhinatrema bivittatum]|uniref:cytochrome P450 2K6-like isoform X2 n=1 Tax=Rhinatrema bivittatum TaxID=194408 RepID=UPI00112EC6AC|nr:cytochrome P450 2K6-like isoform X2 [Rhinatrema bivittatum]